MRTLASIVTILVLTACETPLGSGPTELTPDESPDLLPPVHTLELPARYASSYEFVAYADLDGDRATEETELDFGLADGYPRRVEITAPSGYVLNGACGLELGDVVWRSILEVQGTAATLALDGGALAVELREEGTVTVLLAGEIAGQKCSFGDGPTVTTIPLQHRLVVRVHRVAGLVVEQFHQVLADCWDSVVLPSDALLWAPTAAPLDAEGQRFAAINAPAPAAITLRSDGGLTRVEDEARFRAEPGAVSISVDTTLPVLGLRSFEVVGPEALTSVTAALYLRRTASKGSVVERIEDGMAYRVFFPGPGNAVDVHVDAAMTVHGKLCANVPGAWFASASATPGQCAAGPDRAADPSLGIVPVASIRDAGECQLDVTIPSTDHAWTTRFRTTL